MRDVKMSPTFCYCGQPGDITLNMLECVKCKRWFHEECVKCLDLPMLHGDRFYIFICSICNAGSECLGRLELKWSEIVHLLLYNLSVTEKKKYFHIDSAILPYLNENWERFQILGSAVSEKQDKKGLVLNVLQGSVQRYKCGKEVKKCKMIWALRVREPPEPPDILSSKAHIEKDAVVWEFEVKDRRYHILSLKKYKTHKLDKNGKAKSKLSALPLVRHKNGEVARCGGSIESENGFHKSKQRQKRTPPLFSEDSAQVGLLDSLIPIPSNFNGCNNPFESCTAKRTQIQKCEVAEVECLKRTRNGDRVKQTLVTNGYHFSDTVKDCKTKDFVPFLKETNLSNIIAKRVSTTGKVQYLFQSNR